jgi:chromosome segregation ATPase
MNSTYESTGLDEGRDPDVDHVDTSDIEGPEDFTMNMTYWMTAELPLAQIQSRKEASTKVQEVRGDTGYEVNGAQDSTEEGDEAIMEESTRDRQIENDSDSASPTMRANGDTDGQQTQDAKSESSMENEEKVLSYLDALPDTEIGNAATSTPLRVQKRSMLEVPKQPASKARSLQPTVEDYDTPRKPTQETVIHHTQETTTDMNNTEQDTFQDQVADLQFRLEQQDLASKTRITELETILSFTRSELEAARTANYKQKEDVAKLREESDKHQKTHQAKESSVERRLKEQENELNAKMQEFGEELRLQNLAKLQSQREEFEQQLRASEEAKRVDDEQKQAKDQDLEYLRSELQQLKQSKEQELQAIKTTHSAEQQKQEHNFTQERVSLNEKLSAFQARANSLQADLEKATAEARSTREAAPTDAPLQSLTPSSTEDYTSRITGLESRIQSLESQLHASRTVVSAKDQELLRMADLESRVQSVQSQLESARAEVTSKDRELQHKTHLESQLQSLQSQLDSSRANLTVKEQELLRKSDLESRIRALQFQLDDSRTEIAIKDQELVRRSDLESRVQSLQTQLDSSRSDLTAKDQYLLSNIEEQERIEERLNTAQGRIEGLETTISLLRQQLAEAQRQSSKVRTDVERFEKDLEDANDRLEDARAEADRRVAEMDRKLAKMKESKFEGETRFKELKSSYDTLIEDHEAQLEDVRSNAEDAVRKAGALIEQERSEKKRLTKELRSKTIEIENMRSEATLKQADETESSDDDEEGLSSAFSHRNEDVLAKDKEIENLRALLRTQASVMKTLKSESASIRKAHNKLQIQTQSTSTENSAEVTVTLTTLRAELHTLRHENSTLKLEAAAREEDFEAVNKAMDERLAAMLTKVLKERARTVVGKRDGQWLETMEKKSDERELMGKVLMREWGRQEVGVAKEKEGERQAFRYKYVKRT